ncbi:t-SNARE [Multifurca ochricompacta]|uniref:t-SNARE n=1 Tax=Multifurca ochricompacta TaxID=376703 RepID=A0AAD4M863_9AGAM|nr:t-SNARE [Multifurca ochricompacta]
MTTLPISSTSSPSPYTIAPATRSRTLLFISYRDSSARAPRTLRNARHYEESYHPSDENEGLINHQGTSHVSLDVELPPKWVDYVEQVEEILAATHAKVATLDKLHARHVLPGFADRSSEEREIETATTDITKDFRRCQALIQRIGAVAATPDHSFPPTRPDVVQHQDLAAMNTQRGLAAKVQELSATFRKKQRVYMEKLQGHAIKNQDLLVASGVTSLRGSDALTAVDEDVEAASRSQLVDQQQLEPGLRARDRELTEIAKSIATLAELFKDLSSLVIDQGTLLDSVEYNIEQTATHMNEAVKELVIATRYQKNTGRRKCIFLLLLIIFGLIVVLIFKPRRHSSSVTPTPIPTQAPQIPGSMHT